MTSLFAPVFGWKFEGLVRSMTLQIMSTKCSENLRDQEGQFAYLGPRHGLVHIRRCLTGM